LARSMPAEQFGFFFAVYNVVLMLGWMKGLSFGSIIQKFVPGYALNEEGSKIKSILVFVAIYIFLSSILLLLLALFFPESLINNYFQSNMAKSLVLVLLFFVVIDDFSKMISTYFLSIRLPLFFSLRDFLFKITVLTLILFITVNVMSVAWVYVFAAFFTLIINLFILFRPAKFYGKFHGKTSITKKMVKKMFSYSAPLMVKDFFGVFLASVDNIFLIYFRPLTEVAIYNALLPTAELLLFICRPFAKVLFSLSAELFSVDNIGHLRRLLSLIHKYLLLILIPLALLIAYLSPYILDVMFGEVYKEGSMALMVLLVGFVLAGFNMVSFSVLKGIGRTKEVAIVHISKNTLNFGLNFFLIPFFGVYGKGYFGAVFSTLIAFSLAFALIYYYLKKSISYTFPLSLLLLVSLGGGTSLLVSYVLTKSISLLYLRLGLSTIIFVMLYMSFIFLMRITSLKELQTIIGFFKKK